MSRITNIDNDLRVVQAQYRSLLKAYYDLSKRFNTLVARNSKLRRQIDAALKVTPEQRQIETKGAGLDSAVALLIKRHVELKHWISVQARETK